MSDDKTWDNVQALLEYSGVLKLGRNAAGWWAWFGEVGRGGTYFRAYPTLAETVGLMPAPKTPPERDSKGEAELAAIVAERDQLRAALAAANVRAEEAEADLASLRAQLDPIRQHLATLDAVRRKLDEDYNNANRNGLLLLLDCIRTLAQQDEGEVQP